MNLLAFAASHSSVPIRPSCVMHHVRCKIISYSTGTHLQTKEQLLSCSAPEQAAASYRCWGGGAGELLTQLRKASGGRRSDMCVCVFGKISGGRVSPLDYAQTLSLCLL